MSHTSNGFRLNSRDWEILDHLKRYRLTTREVLHSQFFDDSDISAVSKVTTRLCKTEILNRHEFLDRVYFVVGDVGRKLISISASKTKAMRGQSFIDNYAFLQFCFCTNVARERLLVSEVQQFLGTLEGKSLRPGMMFVDFSEGQSLAAVRVDHGGEPDHILRRTKEFLERAVSNPKITQLIKERRFLIYILTHTPEKQTAILDAYYQQLWPVLLKVEVVPGLASVVTQSIMQGKKGPA